MSFVKFPLEGYENSFIPEYEIYFTLHGGLFFEVFRIMTLIQSQKSDNFVLN